MILAETLGRRFFEDLLSPGNWDVGPSILAQDVVMHHPASLVPIQGWPAVQGLLSGFRAGFPDLNITIQHSFGSLDYAVVRWQMTGTHTEVLFGIPPTGKSVVVNGISIVREAGGLIVEDWVSEDTSGLMRQLGVA